MCGIGSISAKSTISNIEEITDFMSQQLLHRGPDHQEVRFFSDYTIALLHTRLSIVDLSSAGNQPISNEDQSVALVCNGEIYNYLELRAELQRKGHKFHSKSDSEVILHLYEEYGVSLLDRIHGMFAFVLYDKVNNHLFCARDRLGKKPLSYAQTLYGTVIASEIPALKYFPGIDWSIDPTALGLYFLRNLRHIPDPWTLYRGVRRLSAGHAMLIQNGEVKKIWRYWFPSFRTRSVSTQEILERFDQAVSLRRIADVEVAALLSGGVDSSAIVQAMVAQENSRVRTYALGRDKEDEELVRAREMAAYLGTEHKEFYFNPDRQHEQFRQLIQIYGEPIMLLPLTFTYELCQQIRDDGIRVVMAGHGADEIFYGYSGHNNLALISNLLPFIPSILRPMLKQIALKLPQGSKLREIFLVSGTVAGQRKASLYKDEARRLWASLFKCPEPVKAIEESITNWLSVWFEESLPESYIDESSIIGLMHENSHSVTIAGDLPAMAASIEVRCPFLDHDLVQLAWQTSYRQKIKTLRDQGMNKWILKKALENRLPRKLLYAPKRGFGYSIQEEDVLRGPWKSQVDSTFKNMDSFGGLLNTDSILAIKNDFDQASGAPAIIIAKLYALQCFHR